MKLLQKHMVLLQFVIVYGCSPNVLSPILLRPKIVLRATTPSSIADSRFKYNTNNCVRKNSVQLSDYGTGFSSERPWFESRSNLIFLPCIYSCVSLLRTLFVRIDQILYTTQNLQRITFF